MSASAWQLRQAARVVRAGGVIAYPTESVYGLGCNPLDADAVDRVLALKGRDYDKGMIIIGACFDQLAAFLGPLSTEAREQILTSWPGAVTWVVPAARALPDWLTGGRDTVAVRVPGHAAARALCNTTGPLVSTSANRSGGRPARHAFEARIRFGTGVAMYLAGPVGGAAGPSEIRDLGSGRIVRESVPAH